MVLVSYLEKENSLYISLILPRIQFDANRTTNDSHLHLVFVIYDILMSKRSKKCVLQIRIRFRKVAKTATFNY